MPALGTRIAHTAVRVAAMMMGFRHIAAVMVCLSFLSVLLYYF